MGERNTKKPEIPEITSQILVTFIIWWYTIISTVGTIHACKGIYSCLGMSTVTLNSMALLQGGDDRRPFILEGDKADKKGEWHKGDQKELWRGLSTGIFWDVFNYFLFTV